MIFYKTHKVGARTKHHYTLVPTIEDNADSLEVVFFSFFLPVSKLPLTGSASFSM